MQYIGCPFLPLCSSEKIPSVDMPVIPYVRRVGLWIIRVTTRVYYSTRVLQRGIA